MLKLNENKQYVVICTSYESYGIKDHDA